MLGGSVSVRVGGYQERARSGCQPPSRRTCTGAARAEFWNPQGRGDWPLQDRRCRVNPSRLSPAESAVYDSLWADRGRVDHGFGDGLSWHIGHARLPVASRLAGAAAIAPTSTAAATAASYRLAPRGPPWGCRGRLGSGEEARKMTTQLTPAENVGVPGITFKTAEVSDVLAALTEESKASECRTHLAYFPPDAPMDVKGAGRCRRPGGRCRAFGRRSTSGSG